ADQDHDRLSGRRDPEERREHEHRVEARALRERGQRDRAPREQGDERDDLKQRKPSLQLLQIGDRVARAERGHPVPPFGAGAVRPSDEPATTATSSTTPNATWT